MRDAFYEHYVEARLLLSQIASWPIFTGASHKLYPGRFAKTHELSPLMGHHGESKASLLLGVGAYGRPLRVTTDQDHPELGSLAVIGRSRCGKGLLAKSQLLTWPHSVIVNDIKGDLYHDTAGYRSLFSDIKVIDTRGVGDCYDPFTNRHTEEELRALAQYLLFEPNEGHGKAFTDRGIRVLLQLFKAARIEACRPFPYVAHFAHLGFNDTIARLDAVSHKAGLPPHKNLARRVLDDDVEAGHAAGVFLQDAWSTMISKLEPVITENVLKTVSGSDFTAQDIMCGKKPMTLYLRWPEAHVDAQAPLIRLIVSTLFDDMKTIYDQRRGEGCREILWILDEAGRAPVPKLPEYAATALGRRITLWIAYQSRSQPEKIYGSKGADELFDNIDSILHYRPAIGNYKSSAQLQEAMGFTTAFAKSQTTHADHETSEGESEQKIPLMVASEIQRMENHHIVGGHGNIGYFRSERMDYRNWPVLLKRSTRKPPAVAPLPDAEDIPPFHDAETGAPDFIDPDNREIIVPDPSWPAVSRFQKRKGPYFS